MNNLHISNAPPIAGGTDFSVLPTQAADDFTHQLPPSCAELSKRQCQLLSEAVRTTRNRLENAEEVPAQVQFGFESEILVHSGSFEELLECARGRLYDVALTSYPDFLLVTDCCWTVPGKNTSQLARLIKKYGSSRAVPGAVYCVRLWLETRLARNTAGAHLHEDPLSTRRRTFTQVQGWTELAPGTILLMDGFVALMRNDALKRQDILEHLFVL
jgi:primosomal replication protein N